MRPAALLTVITLALAPAAAQAGVHLHLPHPKKHRALEAKPADTPTSTIPDAAWANSRTSR